MNVVRNPIYQVNNIYHTYEPPESFFSLKELIQYSSCAPLNYVSTTFGTPHSKSSIVK